MCCCWLLTIVGVVNDDYNDYDEEKEVYDGNNLFKVCNLGFLSLINASLVPNIYYLN